VHITKFCKLGRWPAEASGQRMLKKFGARLNLLAHGPTWNRFLL